MNVTDKTIRTFSITDITQHQAQDLLTICVKLSDAAKLDADEKETLSNVRQALLAAGVIPKRGDTNAD